MPLESLEGLHCVPAGTIPVGADAAGPQRTHPRPLLLAPGPSTSQPQGATGRCSSEGSGRDQPSPPHPWLCCPLALPLLPGEVGWGQQTPAPQPLPEGTMCTCGKGYGTPRAPQSCVLAPSGLAQGGRGARLTYCQRSVLLQAARRCWPLQPWPSRHRGWGPQEEAGRSRCRATNTGTAQLWPQRGARQRVASVWRLQLSAVWPPEQGPACHPRAGLMQLARCSVVSCCLPALQEPRGLLQWVCVQALGAGSRALTLLKLPSAGSRSRACSWAGDMSMP